MEKSCHQSAWRNAWKTRKATGPQSKYWMLPSLMQQVSCLFTVSSLGSPTAPTPIWHWYPITSKISWDQGHTKTSCRSCIGIQYDSFRTALIVWSVKDSGRIWTASHLAGVVNWNPLRLLQGSGRCCGNSHLLVVSSWNRPSFQVPDPVCIWNIRFDDWMVAIKAVQPSRQGKDPVIGFQGHHRVNVTAEKGCRPSWTRIFTMKLHGSTESERIHSQQVTVLGQPLSGIPSRCIPWRTPVWSKKCWVSLLRKCSKTLSLLKPNVLRFRRHKIFEHFRLNTPRSFLLHHTNNKARPGRRHFGAVVAYTGGGSPANPPTQTWETSLSKQVSQVWVGGLKGDPPPV